MTHRLEAYATSPYFTHTSDIAACYSKTFFTAPVTAAVRARNRGVETTTRHLRLLLRHTK